jgi:hypothetical protein
MQTTRILIAISAAVGLVSGPWSLESARLSEPPIRWGDLTFIFFGCIVALPLLFGFQAAMGRARGMRFFWWFFALTSVYFLSTGVSAIVAAAAGHSLGPHAFMFLAMGVGSLCGVALAKAFFGSKWATGT